MKRVWIARIYSKRRNTIIEGEYHQVEADSPEELLEKLLRMKHRVWFELDRVEIIRKIHTKHIEI